MRYTDIKRHLQPYQIVARRKTTINHAFAAAIAPCDAFEEARIREAIVCLGQDPDLELRCVYCGNAAETWDHVFAIVQGSTFSGYGHRLGNLLPCCKPCNSKKGNKDWRQFLQSLPLPPADRENRVTTVEGYLRRFSAQDPIPGQLPEYQQLQAIKQQIIDLMAQADAIANAIRERNAV